jgi:NhaP-type Na+/H+ or K+/H+ antiporter
MGIRGPQILVARTRLQGYFVWDILDFVINATLFVLIGLQLRAVVDGLFGYSASTLAGYAMVMALRGAPVERPDQVRDREEPDEPGGYAWFRHSRPRLRLARRRSAASA